MGHCPGDSGRIKERGIMDYSKLPKLAGDSQGAQPPAAAPPSNIPSARHAPEPMNTGYAWLSIGIGVILLFLQPNLLKYLFGGTVPQAIDETGAPMRYVDSVFFLGDLAMTCFAIVLILEGLLIAFTRNALVILVVFVFTALATVGNLFYIIYMMQKGYTLQLMPALAVVFGVYIAMYQWRLFQAARR